LEIITGKAAQNVKAKPSLMRNYKVVQPARAGAEYSNQ
jgi:hypothetical protein